MAVAFDAKTATSTVSGSVTTVTVSNMTVGSGSNRALIVLFAVDSASTLPAGLTAVWDSGGTNQSMTQIVGTNTGTNGNITCASCLFGLVAPTSGNKSLVVSWTGSQIVHVMAASFTGVDQTGGATSFPNGTFVNLGSAATSPITLPITSAAGNMVVGAFGQAASFFGAISGTTIAIDTTAPNISFAGAYDNGASTVTMTAAYSGPGGQIASGTDILAAGGGGAVTTVAPLFGMGIPRKPLNKRRSFLTPAAATVVAPVFSTPTLVQHTATGFLTVTRGLTGNNFVLTLPNPVGAGNALVLAFTYQHGLTVTSITDNNSNTWPGSAAVSVDAGAGNYISAAYVLPNANAGVTTITVNFSSTTAVFQLTCSEFNNLASASVVNGTQSATGLSGSTLSTGSFTPTINNDASGGNIIWNYAAPSANTVSTVAAIAAGSGFTLLDADISVKDNSTAWPVMSEWFVQTTQASINPSFTQTTGGSNTFNALALALTVASGGTAIPAGIHINKLVHHTSQASSTTWKFQMPVTGNLLVIANGTTSGLFNITGVTDSDGNTYASDDGGGFAQFWYANVTPNPNLVVTQTVSPAAIGFSMRAYDVQGAASSSPKGASAGNGQSWTSSVPTHISNMPNITPLTTNGLAIAAAAAGHGPFTGFFTGSPPGAIFDAINYTGETDFDTIDNADGPAHVYLTSTTAQTWNWTISTVANDNAWCTVLEFKAASSTSNFTLAGAEGAFTISGQAAGLQVGLPGAEGVFTISGQAAGLSVGLPGVEGAFVISGKASTELRGITSPSSEGAFVISGQAAGLQVGLPGAEGVFTISGQAAGLSVGLPGTEGAFVINGQAATLTRSGSTLLAGDEGVFTISGQSAALNKALHLAGAEGSFSISGQSSTELRGITLGGAEGAFTISGGAATLSHGSHLANVAGVFTISGQAAALAIGLPAAEGAFVISGKSSSSAVALSIKGAEGAFLINGPGASLVFTPAGGGPPLSHSNPFMATVGAMTCIN